VTTASSIVERARRRLTGTQRDVVNQLGVGCSATAGEITLSFDASEFTAFSVLEIDLELMLVISTNGQRITVLRGYGGTNSDNHDAGALVRSAPVIYAADIFEAMNDELRDLSSPLNGLFRVEPIDFSMSVEEAYDLAATEQVLGLAKVEYREINTYKQWRKVCNPRLTLDASTDDFPSGVSLALQGVGIGRQVRVWVKTAFSVPGRHRGRRGGDLGPAPGGDRHPVDGCRPEMHRGRRDRPEPDGCPRRPPARRRGPARCAERSPLPARPDAP
jgi:hypothetical protein